MKRKAVEEATGICGKVMGRKRMSPERKVKEIAFARKGGRRVGEDWVRRVERRFDERQRLEGEEEDKRREVCWRPERREGEGEEHEQMRQVKGRLEREKGKERARGLAKDRREQEGEIQEVKAKKRVFRGTKMVGRLVGYEGVEWRQSRRRRFGGKG